MDASLRSRAEQLAGDIAGQAKTVEDLNSVMRLMMQTTLEQMPNSAICRVSLACQYSVERYFHDCRPSGRLRGEAAWPNAGGVFVVFMHRLGNLFDCVSVDQTNDATSEATAGHAGAENACARAQFSCKIDEEIEFAATYFVVVSQRRMALNHALTDGWPVGCIERVAYRENTMVFGDDVPSAANADRPECFLCSAD